MGSVSGSPKKLSTARSAIRAHAATLVRQVVESVQETALRHQIVVSVLDRLAAE